jgi:hypothetical protein
VRAANGIVCAATETGQASDLISVSAFSSQYVMRMACDIISQCRVGIVNVNVEPTPTWLVTPILPP